MVEREAGSWGRLTLGSDGWRSQCHEQFPLSLAILQGFVGPWRCYGFRALWTYQSKPSLSQSFVKLDKQPFLFLVARQVG